MLLYASNFNRVVFLVVLVALVGNRERLLDVMCPQESVS